MMSYCLCISLHMLFMTSLTVLIKDGAIKRKALLAATYQQIRDMLAQEEQKAHIEVDCELEVGQMKLRNLMKRLTDNAEAMRKVREDVNSLLSQSHTMDFLQVGRSLLQKDEVHLFIVLKTQFDLFLADFI